MDTQKYSPNYSIAIDFKNKIITIEDGATLLGLMLHLSNVVGRDEWKEYTIKMKPNYQVPTVIGPGLPQIHENIPDTIEPFKIPTGPICINNSDGYETTLTTTNDDINDTDFTYFSTKT